MRLFIAIHFTKQIEQLLFQAIQQLKQQSLSGNYTRPENLHLTLSFIGETSETAVLKEILQDTASAIIPFPLMIKGYGHFGSLWWIGIQNNPALIQYVSNLRGALLKKGFAVDTKAFKPHITIARQLQPRAHVSLQLPPAEMMVNRVSLMQSQRINGKLIYTELYGTDLHTKH